MTLEAKLIWAHGPRAQYAAHFFIRLVLATSNFFVQCLHSLNAIFTKFMGVRARCTSLNHNDLFNLYRNYFPLFEFISFCCFIKANQMVLSFCGRIAFGMCIVFSWPSAIVRRDFA